jgi:hypothetical protein
LDALLCERRRPERATAMLGEKSTDAIDMGIFAKKKGKRKIKNN